MRSGRSTESLSLALTTRPGKSSANDPLATNSPVDARAGSREKHHSGRPLSRLVVSAHCTSLVRVAEMLVLSEKQVPLPAVLGCHDLAWRSDAGMAPGVVHPINSQASPLDPNTWNP
jgi:hypothetical protein